jgi:hypothetical protein
MYVQVASTTAPGMQLVIYRSIEARQSVITRGQSVFFASTPVSSVRMDPSTFPVPVSRHH